MDPIAIAAGVVLILIVLWDAFETIVLPRRASFRFRLTRLFYRSTWPPFAAAGRRLRAGNSRENFLSVFGPLSLLFLLATWALALIFGFALLQAGLGSHLSSHGGNLRFRRRPVHERHEFLHAGTGRRDADLDGGAGPDDGRGGYGIRVPRARHRVSARSFRRPFRGGKARSLSSTRARVRRRRPRSCSGATRPTASPRPLRRC